MTSYHNLIKMYIKTRNKHKTAKNQNNIENKTWKTRKRICVISRKDTKKRAGLHISNEKKRMNLF